MRRRTCAAALLCGPLVAGCGTATRVDFASHSRPASPLEVSVYVGSDGVAVDPAKVSPGPVQFNVTNQSGRALSVAVTVAGGRALARTPTIPSGGTAQLKHLLGRGRVGVGISNLASSVRSLTLAGPPRSGDDELTQP